MAFPPYFLDEIRNRVGLATLIGRRVKLSRKGGEFTGLCPFHNERTPSFFVNEVKAFYHCFGCGAHGDQFGFVMRMENLSFPEAVERLAGEAGLEVPEMSPEERRQEKTRASLLEVMEAACSFFERSLHAPGGKIGADYLAERGLDAATIARFRLGFAPDSRTALKTALLGESIDEALLVEGGLLIRPEDFKPGTGSNSGGAAYDRFRGRVTFPITDRQGRVIAFGARALSSGQQAKYLNSPDTPLFHKGQVLYNMATAWPAAREEKRLVVAEGYMDVIALVRAGISAAVAPLGTALTESQIGLLWRMDDEPILCFDGDAAGLKAAFRAAERALPLLSPGQSLRFVTLPAGEDPDTLIAKSGVAAMEELLEGARPLDQMVWDMEAAGKPLDTPERIAGLESRLEARAYAIPEKKVQYQYLAAFRARLREAQFQARKAQRGQAPRGQGPGGQGPRRTGQWRPGGSGAGRFGGGALDADSGAGSAATTNLQLIAALPAGSSEKRREQALLGTLIRRWPLLDEFAETLGTLEFSDPDLAGLRQEMLSLYAATPDLDTDSVRRHLKEAGCGGALDAAFAPDALIHAVSRVTLEDNPGGADETASGGDTNAVRAAARAGIIELIQGIRMADAQRRYREDPSDENFVRLQECRASVSESQRQSL
jgi:DNA primase